MTRNDYEQVASAIGAARPTFLNTSEKDLPAALAQWRKDVDYLADRFFMLNARFNRAKFLKACGVEG